MASRPQSRKPVSAAPTADSLKEKAARSGERAKPAAPAPLLEVRNLCVSYGDREAVHDTSLRVLPGEILGIVGESGAGKSSVLHAVAGLLPEGAAVRGSVRFQGAELAGAPEGELERLRGTCMSTVFQNPASSLDPSMRIGSQIAELLQLKRNIRKRDAKGAALDLLSRMRFHDPRRVFRARPFELSGGMQQRAAIALAMACDPQLLLADEPTSALDATTQAAIADELGALNREKGTALLIVTHNIALAASLCDRIAVMQAGRIVEEGDARTVAEHPQSPCARKLVAAVPRLER